MTDTIIPFFARFILAATVLLPFPFLLMAEDAPSKEESLESEPFRQEDAQYNWLRLGSLFDDRDHERRGFNLDLHLDVDEQANLGASSLGVNYLSPARQWRLRTQIGVIGKEASESIQGISPYLYQDLDWRSAHDAEFYQRAAASMALLYSRARFFADDRGDFERTFDSMVEGTGLAPYALLVDYDFHGAFIPIGAAFYQLGQMYPMPWDLDVGWMTTFSLQHSWIFPNLQTDVSLGAQWRPDLLPFRVALWAGESQNFSPAGQYILQDAMALRENKVPFEVHAERAPHLGAAVYGPLPLGLPGDWIVDHSVRFNPLTTAAHLGVGVNSRIKDLPIQIGMGWEHEEGDGIEFNRDRKSAYVNVSPWELVQMTASVGAEDFRYGDARYTNVGAFIGLRGTWGKHPVSVALTARPELEETRHEDLPYGREQMADDLARIKHRLAEELIADLERLKDEQFDQAFGPYRQGAGDAQEWNDENLDHLIEMLRLIDAITAGQSGVDTQALIQSLQSYRDLIASLNNAIRGAEGSSREAAHRMIAALRDLNNYTDSVVRDLGQSAALERVAQRGLRYAVQEAARQNPVRFRLFNRDLRMEMGGAHMISAAQIMNGRLSPLPPLRRGDIEEYIVPFGYWQLSRAMDNENPDADAGHIIETGLQNIPEQDRDRVRNEYGPDAKSMLDSGMLYMGSMTRSEANQMMLDATRAGEQQDDLTITRGRKANELSGQGLLEMFRRQP
ncbi:MAG: hypothetical protein HYT79_01995 [Elusimicrobia bacterium]|nr:hypothetical protein [Elusimicrobiota bacterium]